MPGSSSGSGIARDENGRPIEAKRKRDDDGVEAEVDMDQIGDLTGEWVAEIEAALAGDEDEEDKMKRRKIK